MNDYTRALHQRFCQEPENTEEEREMDRAEQALKSTLDREQRKLLLALVNTLPLWEYSYSTRYPLLCGGKDQEETRDL